MFGIGSTELIVILVVALIVLGPKKLPGIARSIGKALGEFRRAATDVKQTIEREVEQVEAREKAVAEEKTASTPPQEASEEVKPGAGQGKAGDE